MDWVPTVENGWLEKLFMKILALAAAAFNLICSGQMEHRYGGKIEKSEGYVFEFSIDLDRGIYCLNPCKSPRYIKEISDSIITLERDNYKTANATVESEEWVGRITGNHRRYYYYKTDDLLDPNDLIMYKGECEARPFSEIYIPERKF